MLNLLKIAALLGSLYIESDVGLGFWGRELPGFDSLFIGPLFGAVVVIWQAGSLSDLAKRGSWGFVLLATIIYAFLYGVGIATAMHSGVQLFGFSGSRALFPGIETLVLVPALLGSVLLPLAHKGLGASWTRITVAIPCLCVAYYYIGLLLFEVLGVREYLHGPTLIDYGINGVSLWQVAYLVCMFVPVPSAPWLRSWSLATVGMGTLLIVGYVSLRPQPEPTSWTPAMNPAQTQLRTGSVKVNPQDGLEYVWISAGSFQMGCMPEDDSCSADEKPRHPVEISKGFWMGHTEVTVAAYMRFAQKTRHRMPRPPLSNPHWKKQDHPINFVTWHETRAYCEWAGGRLPTEAEWEYAARGGEEELIYPWGKRMSDSS